MGGGEGEAEEAKDGVGEAEEDDARPLRPPEGAAATPPTAAVGLPALLVEGRKVGVVLPVVAL